VSYLIIRKTRNSYLSKVQEDGAIHLPIAIQSTGDTAMAIYMQVDGIKGSSTAQGYEGWIELNSFQWGVSRSIGTAARGAAARESASPTISEIVVTKRTDASSVGLLRYALGGGLDKKFTISFTTTTVRPIEYLKYQLENVGLSHFSLNSNDEIPVESLSLNFTKITETFTPSEPGTGGPQTVGYDLTTMTES
jgi:type VI secretion system secreted protein Hcp